MVSWFILRLRYNLYFFTPRPHTIGAWSWKSTVMDFRPLQLYLGNRAPVSIGMRFVGSQRRWERCGNYKNALFLLGIESRTLQSVANTLHCVHYAVYTYLIERPFMYIFSRISWRLLCLLNTHFGPNIKITCKRTRKEQVRIHLFYYFTIYCSTCFECSYIILQELATYCGFISCVVLLWFDVCWCHGVVRLGWCGILM